MPLISQNPEINARVQQLLRIKDTSLSIVPFTPSLYLNVNDYVFGTSQFVVESTNNATVFTTSADPKRQFYLTGVNFSAVAGGVAEIALVRGVIGTMTASTPVLSLALGDATIVGIQPQASTASVQYIKPIPLARNTSITITQTALASYRTIITGFYENY